MGLVNLFWEPTAAGKGGEEWSAATRLMRQIHELISALDLQREEDQETEIERLKSEVSRSPRFRPQHVTHRWTLSLQPL